MSRYCRAYLGTGAIQTDTSFTLSNKLMFGGCKVVVKCLVFFICLLGFVYKLGNWVPCLQAQLMILEASGHLIFCLRWVKKVGKKKLPCLTLSKETMKKQVWVNASFNVQCTIWDMCVLPSPPQLFRVKILESLSHHCGVRPGSGGEMAPDRKNGNLANAQRSFIKLSATLKRVLPVESSCFREDESSLPNLVLTSRSLVFWAQLMRHSPSGADINHIEH